MFFTVKIAAKDDEDNIISVVKQISVTFEDNDCDAISYYLGMILDESVSALLELLNKAKRMKMEIFEVGYGNGIGHVIEYGIDNPLIAKKLNALRRAYEAYHDEEYRHKHARSHGTPSSTD